MLFRFSGPVLVSNCLERRKRGLYKKLKKTKETKKTKKFEKKQIEKIRKMEETKMKREEWKPLFSGFKTDGEAEAALVCGWCRGKHKAG